MSKKPKNQEPKKRQPIRLVVHNIRGLKEVVNKFPDDAKVYVDYDGDLIVYQGKIELAKIHACGF